MELLSKKSFNEMAGKKGVENFVSKCFTMNLSLLIIESKGKLFSSNRCSKLSEHLLFFNSLQYFLDGFSLFII